MISISGLSPANNSRDIATDKIIEFSIIDDGSGIDISSLYIEINGDVAYKDLEFKSEFDNVNSLIDSDGDNYNISIQKNDNYPEGKIVNIKIQVKNFEEQYLNNIFSFKTISASPGLSDSSPKNNEIIKVPQKLFLRFEDPKDNINTSSINITLNSASIISNGTLNYNLLSTYTTVNASNNYLELYLDFIEPLKDGDYTLIWSLQDTQNNSSKGRLNFEVKLTETVLLDIFPQTGFLGFFQGIQKVSNIGDGTSLKLEWNIPVRRHYTTDLYVLLYANEKRLSIFDQEPLYFSLEKTLNATISGFQTGKTLSFAARAMETYRDALDLSNLTPVADGVYRFPKKTILRESLSKTDNKVYVDSVSGYPKKGYLKIDSEVIRYNSISEEENFFSIPDQGRGLINGITDHHFKDAFVTFFNSCQDDNTVIIMSTPVYSDGYLSEKESYDTGFVVTDYQDNDKKFFQGFDFCGYHKYLPQQTLNGVDDCGSYLGGNYNGFRGFNLFDRMIGQEEVLLDQVGEPIILLKRIWDGQVCSCMNSRRTHPKVKSCKECFGTGFVGGYSQYQNNRRPDKRIMLSFGDASEDLKLGSYQHLEQDFEPSAWTLPVPAIKDRDLIVRFDFTDDMEYIYEVLRVSREKVIFRHFTRQRLELKRLDKTDIVYTYKWVL